MNYVWEEIWKSDPYSSPEERVSRAKRRLESIRNALEPKVDLGRVIDLDVVTVASHVRLQVMKG